MGDVVARQARECPDVAPYLLVREKLEAGLGEKDALVVEDAMISLAYRIEELESKLDEKSDLGNWTLSDLAQCGWRVSVSLVPQEEEDALYPAE